MDRIIRSRFGSQVLRKFWQPNAHLECVLMDDHFLNHFGNEALGLMVIFEVIRLGLGFANDSFERTGRGNCSTHPQVSAAS